MSRLQDAHRRINAEISQEKAAALGRAGERLPPGTRVEAYAGDVRCGVGSTRRTGNYSGYILSVVGPDSVAGCDRDGTLTFRIDGQPATNAPGGGHTLDLILRRGPSSRGACSRTYG